MNEIDANDSLEYEDHLRDTVYNEKKSGLIINIELKDGQSGYDAVGEYIRRY